MDLRYIELIKYQNSLIAEFLGYKNKENLLLNLMCKQAHEIYSTSIFFRFKLKYALDYCHNNNLVNHEICKNYLYFISIYDSKINLFHIKKIKLPL